MAGPKDIAELLRSGSVRKGNDPYFDIKRVPTGLKPLDDIMGGGIPLGRGILSFGPESTGKTLVAQKIAAAIQQTARPDVLYLDLERTYDEKWWKQSGVDTDNLMVADPQTGEKAIDIMRGVLLGSDTIGLIILDSIAALVPAPEMDEKKSSEENQQPGMQAKLTTLMYRQIMGLLEDKVAFYATNQMRETIGGYDELAALPGGRAQRHYSHIILRTRRSDWINDPDGKHTGFYMDITSRKNKVSTVPDGTNITLPFLFANQIDMLTMYLETAKNKNILAKRGPYYYWKEKAYLGMPNLRTFFLENPEETTELEQAIEAS